MALFRTDKKPVKKTKDVNPFLEEFFQDMMTPFSELDVRRDFSPALNIREEGDSYFVDTELPGVNKNDVTIDIKNDHLIISGEKKSFNEERKGDYHHVERTHGSFYRTVGLPTDVDTDKVNANLTDGVLTVELGKTAPEAAKSRKIEIN